MASIKLTGDTSGEITISAPAVAGTNTLTLPASTGEILTTSNQSTNTPYFVARIGTTHTATDNAYTKAQFDTILSESTSSGFDTTNDKYVVPSGQGGIYQIEVHLNIQSTVNTSMVNCYIRLYKNGVGTYPLVVNDFSGNYLKKFSPSFSRIIDLSAGDELEIYGFSNITSGTLEFTNQSMWSMFKLIT
jgi:hypothetical protein